jgi:hypothetical protein
MTFSFVLTLLLSLPLVWFSTSPPPPHPIRRWRRRRSEASMPSDSEADDVAGVVSGTAPSSGSIGYQPMAEDDETQRRRSISDAFDVRFFALLTSKF